MFTVTIEPRFGDADGLGHINNIVLAMWFETGRNGVFRIFNPVMNLDPAAWNLILAHADYDYLDQMFLYPEVEIRTWIEKIGVTSFTIYHEAWQEGRLCAKGHVVAVHYDFVRHESTPLPEDKRKLLAEHLLPATDRQ
ncbi:MAG: acyl-CoA thioesterase [Spirochaetaceae bacterium]|jgi:acyl-CoA thioester hydrolase|nr:acyl-CoA thioesterase [Spirochaetaceae bacterium]